MSKSRSFKVAALLLIPLLAAGCLKKTELYGGDGNEGGGDDGTTVVSVQYLKSLYRNYPFTIEDDFELDVMVIADDRQGTFANTIVVADESGGIEMKLSGTNLYRDFHVGQNLRISCRNLVLDSYGGVVQLGCHSDNPEYETSFIPYSEILAYINKTNLEINYAIPAELTFAGLQPHHVSTLVAFSDVQFVEGELGLFWTEDDRDTDRHIVNRDGETLIVRTSRNAIFAGQLLPEYSGYIEGVLSYFNGQYQLRVYAVKNVLMGSLDGQPRF